MVFQGLKEKKMNLWDQLAFEYDPKSPTRRLWARLSVWVDIFEKALEGCCKVLDVGCGAGFPAVFLAKRFELFGLDLSKNMLSIAEKRAKENKVKINFVQADSHLLPFKDNAFDGVYCKFAIWPLKEPKKAISEMVRVLKPDGRLVVVEVDRKKKGGYTPSLKAKLIYSVYRFFKYRILRQPDTSRIWRFLIEATKNNPLVNLSTITQSLEESGCKVIEVQKDVKERTYTSFGRLMGSDHEDYFLCIAKKR